MIIQIKEIKSRIIIAISGIILFIAVIVLSGIVFTGCISKPDIKKDYIGFSALEKKLQYKVDICEYKQQFSKIDLKCYEIRKSNQRIENVLNYNSLKKDKKLPKIYRKSGSDDMTFDDLFRNQ